MYLNLCIVYLQDVMYMYYYTQSTLNLETTIKCLLLLNISNFHQSYTFYGLFSIKAKKVYYAFKSKYCNTLPKLAVDNSVVLACELIVCY